ncbi:MAG: signal peptidase I [Methylococcales bacterium]
MYKTTTLIHKRSLFKRKVTERSNRVKTVYIHVYGRMILNFGLMLIVGLYFTERFRISLPSSQHSCLNASFYLIDTYDKKLEKGGLVAFGFPQKNNPWYKENTPFIKIAAGTEGDHVAVSPTGYKINDNTVFLSIKYAMEKLKLKKSDVTKAFVIPKNTFFGVGETYQSYDSRFWGVIPKEKIIGRAYAIL